MDKAEILAALDLFSLGGDGIGGWISDTADGRIFSRLAQLERQPLSRVQFNQLLALGHEAPVSDAFFRYYWLSQAEGHPYNTGHVPGFDKRWWSAKGILSIQHLAWGLHRLFRDGLLYFGNVRTAFRALRNLSHEELEAFFGERRFHTDAMKARGPALALSMIAKDDRYLISEMACKSYGSDAMQGSDLRDALRDAMKLHIARGGGSITIKELLDPAFLSEDNQPRQVEFVFSAEDVLGASVASDEELEQRYSAIANRFMQARQLAVGNTDLYLSMVNDLDVYVATSMRTRADFRAMATDCDVLFKDQRLQDLYLRYFDPTLSAAEGHEDKVSSNVLW